jgi:hypothetical protein
MDSNPGTIAEALQKRRLQNAKAPLPQEESSSSDEAPAGQDESSSSDEAPAGQEESSSSDEALERLPPASVPGWFRQRPDKLKDLSSDPTRFKEKDLVRKGKALKQRKNARKVIKPYLDEILVLGERITMNEEGVSKHVLDRTVNASDAVFFTPAFFPKERDEARLVKAKSVFSKVFGPGSNFSVENPVPPCEVADYTLLKEGLEHRLFSLRMNLPTTYRDEVVSMETRRIYDLAMQYNSLIQAIESTDSLCVNYELIPENGIPPQAVKGYTAPIQRVDQERLQNLLRQFSFLVLQSMNPIPGYESKSSVDANYFIKALESQTLSKEDIDEYLAEYNESSMEVPDLIAQTLEATGSQENIYSLMVEGELTNLMSHVKNTINETLSDATLKTRFNNYTNSLKDESIKDQLVDVLKWIVKEYNGLNKTISGHIDTITTNKATTDALQESLAKNKANIFKLESEILSKSTSLDKKTRDLQKLEESIKAESKEEQIQPDTTNEDLRNELAKRTGERDALETLVAKLNASTMDAMQGVNVAKQTSAGLQGALSAATNPIPVGLLTKVRIIANAVKKGEEPLPENQPFMELYRKFKLTSKEISSSDICYLNYYIAFFIRKLFNKNTYDLYMILNDMVDSFLESFKDIDMIMKELQTLLDISEKANTPAIGYYIVKSAEKASPFFKQFYDFLVKQNLPDQQIVKAIQRAFPTYTMKSLYYVPPLDPAVYYNGFLVKPRITPTTIESFQWNGSKFLPYNTDVSVQAYKNTKISYYTLLTFYILFAKRYLEKMPDNRCPIPKFFKDPTLLLNQFKVPISDADVIDVSGRQISNPL